MIPFTRTDSIAHDEDKQDIQGQDIADIEIRTPCGEPQPSPHWPPPGTISPQAPAFRLRCRRARRAGSPGRQEVCDTRSPPRPDHIHPQHGQAGPHFEAQHAGHRQSRYTHKIDHTAFLPRTGPPVHGKGVMFSKTAITVDSRAKDRNRKNSPPHRLPGPVVEDIGQRYENKRGPLPGEAEAEQAGR